MDTCKKIIVNVLREWILLHYQLNHYMYFALATSKTSRTLKLHQQTKYHQYPLASVSCIVRMTETFLGSLGKLERGG